MQLVIITPYSYCVSVVLEASAYALTEIEKRLNDVDKPLPTDFDSVIGYEFTGPPFTYTSRDVILYALGS